jgi:hypothetical protein
VQSPQAECRQQRQQNGIGLSGRENRSLLPCDTSKECHPAATIAVSQKAVQPAADHRYSSELIYRKTFQLVSILNPAFLLLSESPRHRLTRFPGPGI